MIQSLPYTFRDVDICPCKKRCRDRTPTGKYLWVICPDATGVWESLRTARRMTVGDPAPFVCWWRADYQGGDDPELGIECVVDMSFGKEPGPGVPFFWFWRAEFEVVGPGFAGQFISEWADVFTEQTSCRETPDFTPTLIADPPNPFWSPGHEPGETFTKWGGGISPF